MEITNNMTAIRQHFGGLFNAIYARRQQMLLNTGSNCCGNKATKQGVYIIYPVASVVAILFIT